MLDTACLKTTKSFLAHVPGQGEKFAEQGSIALFLAG